MSADAKSSYFSLSCPGILDEHLTLLGYGLIPWQGIVTGKQIYIMLRKSLIIKYHIIDLAAFIVPLNISMPLC